jgi:hypothetical protein
MAQDHFILPTVPDAATMAVRLGAGNAEAQRLDFKEVGKFVKLVGESRFDLCAVGNDIEGVIYAVEQAPQNGFSIGSVLAAAGTRLRVTLDGLQATPGTGTIPVGAIVVTGTPVAKGTALAGPSSVKVCQATTPANVVFKWRVVSLGGAASGTVGTVAVIERI